MNRTTIATTLALSAVLAVPAHAQILANGRDPVHRELRPGVRTLQHGDQVGRVFGTLATGATPSDSAMAFIAADAARVWGVGPEQLAAYGPFEQGEHLLQLMPERSTGSSRFTGVYFTQEVRGVPVYKSHLLVLTRNEAGFPAVLAASTLWNVDGIEAQLDRADLSALPPASTWTRHALSQFRAQPEVGPARYVIWAGVDRSRAAEPRLAVTFVAEGGGHWDPDNHQRIEFVVDAETGAVLHQETQILHAVAGRVTGMATQGNAADACATEVAFGLPYAEVKTGSTTVYADANGNFSIPGGAPGATYTTRLAGRYFTTYNNSTPATSISVAANDGDSWNPVFNESNAVEAERAMVNAYLHSNIIRDLVVRASPQFPTVSNQASSFIVNVNLANTCNAYYSGSSINFYASGGGCNNTAFGTVVHHEYGHNAVAKAGSGQGEYGEGMGDIFGLLVSDEPQTGVGFQTCSGGIRNADNTCQYSSTACSSCGSEIHSCGRLISGCAWDLRDRLLAAYPATYREILADLCVNSVLLHGAVTTINSEITLDFLILDDDNGNVGDGTPNYELINQSFTAHGLPGPAIELLGFSYPEGVPVTVEPNGSTTLKVDIEPSGTDPNLWTARLYSRNEGETDWTITSMLPAGGRTFAVNIPAGECLLRKEFYVACNTVAGAVATSPSGAPLAYHSAIVASGAELLSANEFEGATAGWTVGASGDNATNGLWVAADPFSTGWAGGPVCQPEDDRSPTGTRAFITGNTTAAGTSGTVRSAADVDTGTTTLTSPAIDLSGGEQARITYWRWYAGWQNSTTPSTSDSLVVQVSGDDGANWVTVETVTANAGAWVERSFVVTDFVAAGPAVRVRFRATDAGNDSTVEAAIDDFRVDAFSCSLTIPADLDGDGRVGGGDLGLLLSNWGVSDFGDLDGDGLVGGADLGLLLSSWGP
jgi:hypothetical protein